MKASEFAEKVLEIELLPYQKEFVDRAYEAAKEHKRIMYIPPRGSSRFTLSYLQALAVIMAAQEEGISMNFEEVKK